MKELKTFNMRMPKEVWKYLRQTAAAKDTSMMQIVLTAVEKYKKSQEKKLTKSDANV